MQYFLAFVMLVITVFVKVINVTSYLICFVQDNKNGKQHEKSKYKS